MSEAREHRRIDVVGWLSLALLVPPLCVAAPAALAVNVARIVWFVRHDRDVPRPTVIATVLAAPLTAFLAWYFWRVSQGDHP